MELEHYLNLTQPRTRTEVLEDVLNGQEEFRKKHGAFAVLGICAKVDHILDGSLQFNPTHDDDPEAKLRRKYIGGRFVRFTPEELRVAADYYSKLHLQVYRGEANELPLHDMIQIGFQLATIIKIFRENIAVGILHDIDHSPIIETWKQYGTIVYGDNQEIKTLFEEWIDDAKEAEPPAVK